MIALVYHIIISKINKQEIKIENKNLFLKMYHFLFENKYDIHMKFYITFLLLQYFFETKSIAFVDHC